MSGEDVPAAVSNDFLAFSTNDPPQPKTNQFRPYNNQWRTNQKPGNFSPQGFSSPISGGFRTGHRGGGGRPRFNQDNNRHDGGDGSRNRLPRNFGHQRPYHNRRGGGGDQQQQNYQQRSFEKINFQAAGEAERSPNMANYYHPSMTEDPWKQFNIDAARINVSTTITVDGDPTHSDSSENADNDSIV